MLGADVAGILKTQRPKDWQFMLRFSIWIIFTSLAAPHSPIPLNIIFNEITSGECDNETPGLGENEIFKCNLHFSSVEFTARSDKFSACHGRRHQNASQGW